MTTWDRRGSGSRDYEEGEYRRVVEAMRSWHVGPAGAVKREDLSREVNVEGRTVRSILSEADGVEFVLGDGDDGTFVAETAEDAESATRRLESQARKMQARASRRRAFDLPRLQETLL